MIRDALAAGCDVYDLRGVTSTVNAENPRVGLIQFKVGTGGRAVRYVGEWDLALRPMIYRAFSRYLSWREGLRFHDQTAGSTKIRRTRRADARATNELLDQLGYPHDGPESGPEAAASRLQAFIDHVSFSRLFEFPSAT